MNTVWICPSCSAENPLSNQRRLYWICSECGRRTPEEDYNALTISRPYTPLFVTRCIEK